MKSIFVVIGGPGFGKTTLVRALEKRGFFCQYDDFSRELIRELSKKGAAVDTGGYDFNRAITKKRVEQFRRAPRDAICFFDRGVPDGLAYMESPPEEMMEMARRYRYQPTVFVTPPWREIFKGREADTGRAEGGFGEALRLHGLILSAYRQLGYRLAEVPKCGVEERADFVLKNVRLSGQQG